MFEPLGRVGSDDVTLCGLRIPPCIQRYLHGRTRPSITELPRATFGGADTRTTRNVVDGMTSADISGSIMHVCTHRFRDLDHENNYLAAWSEGAALEVLRVVPRGLLLCAGL